MFRNICSCLIIFFAEFAHTHMDCNHAKVVDRFFYMCNSYSTSSIKREVPRAGERGLNSRHFLNYASQQPYRYPEQAFGLEVPRPYPQPTGAETQQAFVEEGQQAIEKEAPQQSPQFFQTGTGTRYPLQQTNSAISSNVLPSDTQNAKRESNDNTEVPTSDPPPDKQVGFSTLNEWYLNPVYADPDLQEEIVRWRRKSHIYDEIWKFVHNKCCLTGCPFPHAYWELDKRLNICGIMR